MNPIEFAIQMEHDGEAYYRKQAELNKDNSLRPVCEMLANDEYHHAQVLLSRSKLMSYELTDSDTLRSAKSIFSGIGDIESEFKEIPSQLDFYRIASEKEQQSIDLYTDLLSKADNQQDKELFQYLIGQEKQHFEVLDNLATLLRHTEDWVESAEFGLQKDY